jgi:hypothetical protein
MFAVQHFPTVVRHTHYQLCLLLHADVVSAIDGAGVAIGVVSSVLIFMLL